MVFRWRAANCLRDIVLGVTSRAKLLAKILSGRADQNVLFDELVALLKHLDFQVRTTGSHHIFSREGVVEILNLQPRRDGTAKPYQVKQVRQVLTRYRIAGDEDAI
jgi:HicA toxin of bacterial toxin-antitoxin,